MGVCLSSAMFITDELSIPEILEKNSAKVDEIMCQNTTLQNQVQYYRNKCDKLKNDIEEMNFSTKKRES